MDMLSSIRNTFALGLMLILARWMVGAAVLSVQINGIPKVILTILYYTLSMPVILIPHLREIQLLPIVNAFFLAYILQLFWRRFISRNYSIR